MDVAIFRCRDWSTATHQTESILSGPSAVLLTYADAGSRQLVTCVTANTTSPVEHAITHLFDKVAVPAGKITVNKELFYNIKNIYKKQEIPRWF